ncbi:zinc transporter foi [Bacillus rossius redtenbacheri]|uniref:zinc transporter foi n=1 Tax=Bacillus rossius redtenbacheri TaxID=93214 RepID=UPI002FDCD0D4
MTRCTMMGHQLMTVCVFCVLCTSRSQCSLHSSSWSHRQNKLVAGSKDLNPLKPPAAGLPPVVASRGRREAHLPTDLAGPGESYFIRKVFEKFGDGETMTLRGFEQLLRSMGLEQLAAKGAVGRTDSVEGVLLVNSASDKSNATVPKARVGIVTVPATESSNGSSKSKCLNSHDLFSSFSGSLQKGETSMDVLSPSSFSLLCPSLLYQLVAASKMERLAGCIDGPFYHAQVEVVKMAIDTDLKSVWLYSSLSILGISLCGLLGVVVIPFMQKAFYQKMLQFLVALAIGTLCGDALLHLLPHAMGGESHGHSDAHEHSSSHDLNMWKGLAAALGVVFFFVTEKCLTLLAEWRKGVQKKRKAPHSHVHVMRDDGVGNGVVGEKLCKHKYSSYPYCYGEITDTPEESHMLEKSGLQDHNNHNHNHNSVAAEGGDCTKGTCCDGKAESEPGDASGLPGDAESYTVIIREHENHHHGHSHTHGHVHAPPHNMSSVAWMVIMGDGLHNFTDGMAIGAAFAANIAGGFSTSIAVFCHELPHEIGDFAVLLKAGMSARQAIFYNMLSSILCLFGMILGIFLGTTETASEWIFSVVAGMFLYIALVDMIPELTTNHSKEGGSMFQLVLQFLGLSLGIGLMLLIANYEHDLKTVFVH